MTVYSQTADDILNRVRQMDPAAQVKELTEQAQLLYGSDEELSLDISRSAIRIAETSGDRLLYSDALYSLGFIFFRTVEYDSARYYMENALSVREEIGDSSAIAFAKNRLGNILWNQGYQTEAFKLFREAADLHRALGNRLEEGRAYNNIGNSYRQWANYDKALEFFIATSRIYEDVGYDEGLGWLNFSITMLYRTLGDLDKALQYATKALSIYQGMVKVTSDSAGIMICYGQLGDIHSLLGNYDLALDYHRKALAMRLRINIPSSIADGYTGIGRIHYSMGHYETAINELSRSVELRENMLARGGLATALRYRGLSRLALGDTSLAMADFQRSLTVAREFNELQNQANLLNDMSRIYRIQGQLDKAYDFGSEFRTLKDSIDNLERNKMALALKATYDLENAERENLRLAQANTISVLELQRSKSRIRFMVVVLIFSALLAVLVLNLYRQSKRDNRLLRAKNIEIEKARSLLQTEMHEREKLEKDREKLILELRESLNNVKSLKGLIPICASCKKIRNDDGYYEQLEKYISEHTDAEFSHGICQDCYEMLYPDLAKKKIIKF